MNRIHATLVALCLIIVVFSALGPSLANSGEGSDSIGRYSRLGSEADLTGDHLTWSDGILEVRGPLFTTSLKIDPDFLRSELGDWSSDKPFTEQDGFVEFDSRTVKLKSFDIGPDPAFTWGSDEQIRFLERPMWISAIQEEHGGEIVLTMEDGDATGQEISVSKEWIWSRGIHRPNATHEDGTSLTVTQSESYEEFIIDVPHFSYVVLGPTDLDVKGRSDGTIVPHTGESRWYEEERKLEVDVGQQLMDYEVLVEADWIDMNIVHPGLREHRWIIEAYEGTLYYVVSLSWKKTPTTLVYVEFTPNAGDLYSRGSEKSIWLEKPGWLNLQADVGVINLSYGFIDEAASSVHANITFLQDLHIDNFSIDNGGSAVNTFVYRGDSIYFPLNATLTDLTLASDSGIHIRPEGLDIEKSNPDLELLCEEALGVGGNMEIYKVRTWTGDNDGGSIAELYVRHKRFCFAWDLVAPSGMDEKLYLVAYGIEGNVRACGWGTESSKDHPARKGAAVCDLSKEEEFGTSFHVTFVAGTVDKPPSNKDIFQAGLACASGIVAAVAAAGTGMGPLFAILGATTCAYFALELGAAINYDGNRIGQNLITFKGNMQIDHYINANFGFLEMRKATTYYEFEQRIPEDLRPSAWYGYERIVWTVRAIENAEAIYTPDVSILTIWDWDRDDIEITRSPGAGTVNQLEWKAVNHRIGNSWVETKVGTILGLDWETSYSSLCAYIPLINAETDSIGLRAPHESLPCPAGLVPFEVPVSLDEPWIPFAVDSTTLVQEEVLAVEGSVTLQDVIDANFSIPLALSRAITSNESFLHNITSVHVQYGDEEPISDGEACDPFELEYTARFRVVSSGQSLITGELVEQNKLILDLVCFDPLMLGGHGFIPIPVY